MSSYMYLPLYYHVGVFILRARRPKHESFSLRQVFWLSASKIKTSTQQRVQTERRVIITGLFKSVLVFFLTKTDKESPVIITSLSFVTSCGLIVEKRSEKPMNGMHVCSQTIVEISIYYSKKTTERPRS